MASDNRGDWSWLVPAVLIVVVILVMIGAGLYIPEVYNKPNSAGEFGDMFGGVNALFSGLAFVGVIYAILLQRRELQLQREELEYTRFELKGQKEQLEAQNQTFRQQSFDNAFFRMVALHHQLVSTIDLREGSANASATIVGRDCFVEFYTRLRNRSMDTNRFPRGATYESLRIVYAELYKEIQADVGNYFRNLYHIIKFVDRSQVDDKRMYTNLVRAQLSSHELLLLFYNCLTHLGEEKFKPLIEKYALLKNMPIDELIDESHTRWYTTDAFASGR